MINSVLRRIGVELLCFSLFSTVYYAPFIFESSELAMDEPRVQHLLTDALAVPAVQFELARNALGGHLIPLILYYGILIGSARQFSKATHIASAIARFLFLSMGWMLLIAGNSTFFPLSNYSFVFNVLAEPLLALALAVILSIGVAFALWRTLDSLPLKPWLTSLGALALLFTLVGFNFEGIGSKAVPQDRNIMIIGVDSLSAVTFESAHEYLPNLARLFDHAISFDHAYTPLGRTFPAWTSILSGVSPSEHGAIFNLRNMDHVKRHELFPKTLQANGYHTVLAIDERRFSNIDESFGFNQIVGPKAGALDFVLQPFNDTPLTNLLLQTKLASFILPFSYINTASYVNYDAKAFVNEAVNALSGTQKNFLAIHFESAHFPFKSRHVQRKITSANSFWDRHVEALTAVDAQIGQLMTALAAHGYLDNTLVIILSDHGEALGNLEAQTTQAGAPMDILGYGHGANLLSEHQNRIIFGLIPFKNGNPVNEIAVRRNELVSLLDVRGIVEYFVAHGGIHINTSVDRCLPVETGIRFNAAANYRTFDKDQLAAESATYYEIDAAGRLRLREETLGQLIASKDVGWRCQNRLTYFDHAKQSYFAYVLTDNGQKLAEIQPDSVDVAQIRAYRERLAQLPKSVL